MKSDSLSPAEVSDDVKVDSKPNKVLHYTTCLYMIS